VVSCVAVFLCIVVSKLSASVRSLSMSTSVASAGFAAGARCWSRFPSVSDMTRVPEIAAAACSASTTGSNHRWFLAVDKHDKSDASRSRPRVHVPRRQTRACSQVLPLRSGMFEYEIRAVASEAKDDVLPESIVVWSPRC